MRRAYGDRPGPVLRAVNMSAPDYLRRRLPSASSAACGSSCRQYHRGAWRNRGGSMQCCRSRRKPARVFRPAAHLRARSIISPRCSPSSSEGARSQAWRYGAWASRESDSAGSLSAHVLCGERAAWAARPALGFRAMSWQRAIDKNGARIEGVRRASRKC